MVGDLKYGRTVHSLLMALSKFKTTFNFISPDELKMPEPIVSDMRQRGVPVTETAAISDALHYLRMALLALVCGEALV